MENQDEGTGAVDWVHGEVRFGVKWEAKALDVGHPRDGKRWDSVAYKAWFPQELSKVHNMFYVSNLKKCYSDKPLAIPLEGLQIDDKLYFIKEPA
ncbi:hypothetical protein Tco_0206839 [Tanacetum coccineum]